MDMFGNTSLLNRYLVSFLASRNVDDQTVLRTDTWVSGIVRTEKVVISGFHSPLERHLLGRLLANRHPVVMVLGRTLYRRFPEGVAEAVAEDKMLIVSLRRYSRHSFSSAQIRNWYVTDIADEMVFAGLHSGSSLNVLYDMRRSEGRPTVVL